MLIGIGMRTDTDTVGMYNHRITVGDGILARFRHCIHRIEHILAIAMDDFEILKSGKVIRHFTIGSLIFFRNGNAISVVLPYKDNRQPFKAGTVNSFVNEAFRSSRFAMRGYRHTFVPVVNHSPSYTSCVEVMRTCGRRYILNVPFGFRKMIGHMSSSTSGIGSFGDTVQYQFFHGHPRRKHCQHVPVIWEKEIFPLGKDLSDGKLYAVMSCIRSMIRPAKGL